MGRWPGDVAGLRLKDGVNHSQKSTGNFKNTTAVSEEAIEKASRIRKESNNDS